MDLAMLQLEITRSIQVSSLHILLENIVIKEPTAVGGLHSLLWFIVKEGDPTKEFSKPGGGCL